MASADFPVYDHLNRLLLGIPAAGQGLYALGEGVAEGLTPKSATGILRLALILSAPSVVKCRIKSGADTVEAALYEGATFEADMFYGQIDLPSRPTTKKGAGAQTAVAVTYDVILDNPAASVKFVNIMEVMRHVS